MKTEIINLKGGAKLLFNRQTDVNGIAIRFNFMAGALNDPIGKLGVAHFCEHALCSFSNAKMTSEERKTEKKTFVYRNAFTSSKTMGFLLSVTEEDFERGIDFVTESFKSIKFLKDEFENEKKIILDEVKTRLQINNRLISPVINTKICKDEFYNKMHDFPAGTVETVSKISIEDLQEFIKKYITTNNLVVTISGNIKKSKVVSIINKYVEKNLSESKFNGYDKKEIDNKTIQ